VLLVGSGLLIRTSVALASVDPGFDTTNVLTMKMSLQSPRFFAADAVERLVRDGVDAAARAARRRGGERGVLRAARRRLRARLRHQGRPLTDQPFHGGGGWLTVSPGYFEVFRIAMKRGRSFQDATTRRRRRW
jgi:hypothetical protein